MRGNCNKKKEEIRRDLAPLIAIACQSASYRKSVFLKRKYSIDISSNTLLALKVL